MTYRLDSISLKLENGKESFEKINEIYEDIFSGKIPLIKNTKGKIDKDIIALGEYVNCGGGRYEFTVFADDGGSLFQIRKWIDYGDIEWFEGVGSTIDEARIEARIYRCLNKSIKRIFKNDFEEIIPKKYSKDGKVHCLLYVGIENKYGN